MPPVYIGELSHTPLGTIWLAVSDQGLTAVDLWDDRAQFVAKLQATTGQAPIYAPAQTAVAAQQLQAYLAKERTTFDLPIDWSVMTPFQVTVLQAVAKVGYGRLTTYKQLALDLGQPTAVRAIGRANATNPMPIVVPCHRVLGADGKLHGYSAAGGLETKAWLLRLEGSWLL